MDLFQSRPQTRLDLRHPTIPSPQYHLTSSTSTQHLRLILCLTESRIFHWQGVSRSYVLFEESRSPFFFFVLKLARVQTSHSPTLPNTKVPYWTTYLLSPLAPLRPQPPPCTHSLPRFLFSSHLSGNLNPLPSPTEPTTSPLPSPLFSSLHFLNTNQYLTDPRSTPQYPLSLFYPPQQGSHSC